MLIPTTGFGGSRPVGPPPSPGASECVLSILVENEAEVRDLLERARTAGAASPSRPRISRGATPARSPIPTHVWMVRARGASA